MSDQKQEEKKVSTPVPAAPVVDLAAPARPEKVSKAKKVNAADNADAKDFIKAKAGRIIIRNLGFDIGQKHLKAYFSPMGTINEINVPHGKSGGMNRGFAFVEFKDKEEAESVIKKTNGTKWKGRTVTTAISVPKGSYEARLDGMVEHTKMDK